MDAAKTKSPLGEGGTKPTVSLTNGISPTSTHPTNHDRQHPEQPNGVSKLINGHANHIDEKKAADGMEAPPEIRHITDNFQPLSTLFERVSQECFTSINQLITDAATASTDSDRKRAWLEWAHDQRQRFIKLLVLTQWSRRSTDVSRLIDLYVWTRDQDSFYDQAQYYLGELRRGLNAAKLPNPDIETALEVLSTGRSNKIPDPPGGYIEPDPLSPEEQLKLLHDINVQLHIRLNLHEDLPPQFRAYTIKNGRVTFRVASEFEVDLTLADEEHSSPFFFLDIRFLFSPFTEIPYGQLHEQLEFRINEVLASGGLFGCYNFLHEYVLTHKIDVLRRQAVEMRNSMWNGSIDIEHIHRCLIIRYWLQRPGPKNWIEIGVHSGRSKKISSWRPEEPSHLVIKWFRRGKEDKEAKIPFDVHKLDMQSLLKHVIARHTCSILEAIHDRISTVFSGGAGLNLVTSESEPSACHLSIPVTRSRVASLAIDPVTGAFSFQPHPSSSSKRCADALNSSQDPIGEVVSKIQLWQASELQKDIETHASRYNWSVLTNFEFSNSSVARLFGEGVLRVSVLAHKKWNLKWGLAVSLSTKGEAWWILRLGVVQSAANITTTKRLDVGRGFDDCRDESCRFFRGLERYSEIRISEWSNHERLSNLGLSYKGPFLNKKGYSCLLVDFSNSAKSNSDGKDAERANPKVKPQSAFVGDKMQLIYGGFDKKSVSNMTHHFPALATQIAVGKLRGSSDFFNLLSLTKDPQMKIGKDGLVFVFLKSPLGSPDVIDELMSRLKSLQRLREYITILKSHSFVCDQLEFHKLKFSYDSEQKLQASLEFLKEPGAIALAFEPSNNPHNRLKSIFARLLNNPFYDTRTKFVRFAAMLKRTVGLLYALSEITARYNEQPCHRPFIKVRSASKYLLIYPGQRKILVQLKESVHGITWCVEETKRGPGGGAGGANGPGPGGPGAGGPGKSPQEPRSPLADLFTDYGPGRFGLGTSIVADDGAVGDVLRRVDEVLRK